VAAAKPRAQASRPKLRNDGPARPRCRG
jgi:hypothetical protein